MNFLFVLWPSWPLTLKFWQQFVKIYACNNSDFLNFYHSIEFYHIWKELIYVCVYYDFVRNF